MTYKRISFVSAMGQAFEVLRNITNAVLDLGGDQEDILKILRNPQMTNDIAIYLVGKGKVVLLHPNEAILLAQSRKVRESLVGKVEDPDILYKLATEDEMPSIRVLSTKRITDDRQLFCIVNNCGAKEKFLGVAAYAISRMEDKASLIEIVKRSKTSYKVRRFAAEKIYSLGDKTAIIQLMTDTVIQKDTPKDDLTFFLWMYSCVATDDEDVSVEIHSKANTAKRLLFEQKNVSTEQSSDE